MQCALAVNQSRPELLEALETVSESNRVRTEVAIETQSLLNKVSKPQFSFMAAASIKIFSLLTSANSMMQGKSCNVSVATELISSAALAIKNMRSSDKFGEFASTAGLTQEDQEPPKCQRVQSKLLAGTLITSTLG